MNKFCLWSCRTPPPSTPPLQNSPLKNFTYSLGSSCHLQKLSDHFCGMCVRGGRLWGEYRPVISDFVECQRDKGDFDLAQQEPTLHQWTSRDVMLRNWVPECPLDWTDWLYKRGQSCLYRLGRLGSFGACRPTAEDFWWKCGGIRDLLSSGLLGRGLLLFSFVMPTNIFTWERLCT